MVQQQVDALTLSEKILEDRNLCRFYTGLECIEDFWLLLKLVKEDAEDMKFPGKVSSRNVGAGTEKTGRRFSLSVSDQLLLTLVKLRQDAPEQDMALRFGVSQAVVSCTFRAMVNLLYSKFKHIPIWPTRFRVRTGLGNFGRVWVF